MSFWGKNKKASPSDVEKFVADKKIGNYIWADNTHRLLMVSTKDMAKPKYLLRYNNITSFSVFRDDEEISKGNGIKRAVVGGILFGGVGAVVGAATGGSKQKIYVNNLWITLFLDGKDTEKNKVNIPFINARKTDTSSLQFKKIADDLEMSVNFLNGLF